MSVGKRDYLSRLLVFLILNGTANAKLVMLAFLYCREIVKNSSGLLNFHLIKKDLSIPGQIKVRKH